MTSEEVNTRNVLAIKAHSEQTRELLRELELKINNIINLENKITLMENQISNLQVKVFSGGSTSGN